MDEVEKLKQKMLKKMLLNMQKREKMPSKPIKATDENFDEIISKYDTVVIDFWAPWCGPCRLISPIVEKLAKEYKGKVVFAKLNVDENPKVAIRFRVMSIPTLILFRKGKIADRVVGALPEDMLKDWLERYI